MWCETVPNSDDARVFIDLNSVLDFLHLNSHQRYNCILVSKRISEKAYSPLYNKVCFLSECYLILLHHFNRYPFGLTSVCSCTYQRMEEFVIAWANYVLS